MENIPSPFWSANGLPQEHDEFIMKIEALAKEYGFDDNIFVAFGQSVGNDETEWHAYSKYISEGLMDYLGSCRDHGLTRLEDEGDEEEN